MLPSEKIRDIGWCQGLFYKLGTNADVTAYCLEGAIDTGTDDKREEMHSHIKQLVADITKQNIECTIISGWQDMLPYNQDSKDLIYAMLVNAEYELGVQHAT